MDSGAEDGNEGRTRGGRGRGTGGGIAARPRMSRTEKAKESRESGGGGGDGARATRRVKGGKRGGERCGGEISRGLFNPRACSSPQSELVPHEFFFFWSGGIQGLRQSASDGTAHCL